jgi:galactokinase/mevalonate kinase-like predicted kinase
VAHNILGEIVRGIFLNDARRLSILEDIGYAADFAADVIQKRSWDGLCEAVRRSWSLNQALDAGTNPPPVQAILESIKPWSSGHKLLGAGGGGYLMILANTETDGHRIRHALTQQPPNPRARFVDVSLSETGLQITRS